MANQFRLFLFQYAGHRWRSLQTRHRTEAAFLLALVEAQAPVAVRRESANWEVPLWLAKLYVEVGATHPDYRASAARYTEAARRLAPNRREVRALSAPDEVARP